MFYSPSTNAFYPDHRRALHEQSGTWPSDAVKVTSNELQTYGFGEPPAGKQRGADADGNPAWVDLPETPISLLADQALLRINAGYQAELGALLATYPQAETLTFDKQEREARAWQAWQDAGATGKEPSTPLLSAIAQGRSMSKTEVVARVIKKADSWAEASGFATGKRQAAEDRIAVALKTGDRAVLKAIDW